MKVHVETPFPRSYWVIPGRFLAGAYPGHKDPAEARRKIQGLLECGIRHVVNLMEEGEVDHTGRSFVPYEQVFKQLGVERGMEVSTSRLSIRDMHITTAERMNAILDEIDGAIQAGRPVYVHCWGGRGRTGTVVGCYLVRQGMTGEEALRRIKEFRKDTPDAHGASPETGAQRDMVRGWDKMDRTAKGGVRDP